MARIRTIKPEFWTDEKVVQLPFAARLLFIGMWNFADDEGFLESQSDRLRLQILPNDDVDVDLHVDLLCASGLIERLELEDGRELVVIINFSRHQKISHVTRTRFPVFSGKKRIIPFETRRAVAIKYGCKPGNQKDVECYFCGAKGCIWWPTVRGVRPSAWVAFSGVELDHFSPESNGGGENPENIVLSCRYCNRSRRSKNAIDFALRKIPESIPTFPENEPKNIRTIPENTGATQPYIASTPENTGSFRPEGKGKEGREEEGKKERVEKKDTSPEVNSSLLGLEQSFREATNVAKLGIVGGGRL